MGDLWPVVFGVAAGAAIGYCYWLGMRRIEADYQRGIKRNRAVLAYRTALLDAITAEAKLDIHAGRDWHWRYDTFNAVTFEDMVTSGEPLESFYADLAFAGGSPPHARRTPAGDLTDAGGHPVKEGV